MPPFAPFFAWTGFALFLALAAFVLWTIGFVLLRATWQASLMVRFWRRDAEPGDPITTLAGRIRLFLGLLRREIGAGLNPYTTITGPWGTLGYLPWKEQKRRADEQARWDAEDERAVP